MKYAYIRVSSLDQNIDRQLIAMQKLGIPPENIFTDKQSSKNTARPWLQKLLSTVQQSIL
jgi:DNA invertase Pin-like site-specific DNA recombinase